jgi:hypothetical protein
MAASAAPQQLAQAQGWQLQNNSVIYTLWLNN